ncbi:tetratricopeptide repeat protein [Maribellus maritimus]|uniref:tetratricopeptide repeat protein n=1 Tax=Maribellus maritimus TaxID=2870838 RepID=UPI001EEC27D4|nr:tetratricopeptide repeat protein [Maribellus maritimus]MCG6187780.1 tetratricopeptide repeat protein [Maribellus maritimus]
MDNFNKQLILLFFVILSGFAFSQEEIDLLILNKDYNKALQLIEQELKEDKKTDLYLKKGLIYNKLQMYSEAISALESANELDGGNFDILDEIAETHSILGNYIDAIPYYERALKVDPDNLALAAKLGRNYINLKNYNKAYSIFEQIYSVDTTNVYWNKQFAFCAYQRKQVFTAVALYEKVIAANPRDYSSYFNLIRLYKLLPPSGKIQETIERGMENFPEDAQFFEEQADYYFSSKQYTEARSAYENSFMFGGDSLYKVLMNYGISLYFDRDERKSISILDICAEQVANDPYVLFYLSLNYKRLAEYEDSEAYMKAAIESATPAYLPEMYHHLGQIFGQQRKFEESIVALKKANEMDPENPEVLFEIATTYEEFNANKTLALNYYQIYLKEGGAKARNFNYAQDRIEKIKEDMFFDE